MTDIEAILTIEESGASADEYYAALQSLIDSGIVWQLQGSYQRAAAAALESGACYLPGFSPEPLPSRFSVVLAQFYGWTVDEARDVLADYRKGTDDPFEYAGTRAALADAFAARHAVKTSPIRPA